MKSRLFHGELFPMVMWQIWVDKNGDTQEDLDRFTTNFMVAGYTIPFKNKLVKSVDLSVQSIGLLSYQSYPLSRYIGVGVQANF